ncbi:hypothetical protein [Larkinella punicea]|uniref:Uncharacterized protein n=1 Tax=Larkinella punicea TaxID=2315727 RepID=A0A368JJH5_9BACT|nr:hypothetical protein [Larkinella punicea]RCR67445.1 hypothetical protein DUE52_21835 [Larkinella punicea]
MKENNIEPLEKAYTQLRAFYDEVSILAKKSPDGAINTFKLKFINQTLGMLNDILSQDFMPFPDFTIFNVEDVPTNSDVVLILAQYLKSTASFYDMFTAYRNSKLYWIIDDEISDHESKRNFKRDGSINRY